MWITLSADDVKKTMTTAEAVKVESLVPANTLAGTLSNVILEVRGYVRKVTSPGAGETIPETLKPATLAVARYRFLSAVPGGQLINEHRVREYEDALKLFRAVAAGDFVLEEAETKITETVSKPGPRITGKTLSYDRESQDGI